MTARAAGPTMSGWCLTNRHAPGCRYEKCQCDCHADPAERARAARAVQEKRDGDHSSGDRNDASPVIQLDIQQEPTDTPSADTDWADSPEMESTMSTTIAAPAAKTAAKKAPAKARSTATGSKTRPAASRAKSTPAKSTPKQSAAKATNAKAPAKSAAKPAAKAVEKKPVNASTMKKFVKEVWDNVEYGTTKKTPWTPVSRLGWDDAKVIEVIGDAQTMQAAKNRVTKAGREEEAARIAAGTLSDSKGSKKDTDSADA